ncbi:MAG: hypothetical protein WC254_00275 [Candidatus Woesearchaeota archaeon]|jgi:hypothetical protein
MPDKISLNDIVESGFGSLRERRDFQTEFCLDDGMPKVYTPEAPNKRYVLYSVQQAIIIHLVQEYETHGKGDRRITTTIVENTQILQLDHCGEHILSDEIQFLNETLRKISDGEEVDGGRFRASGNNMAARGLREQHGFMVYENIQDGQYRVRCTVTLPLIQ